MARFVEGFEKLALNPKTVKNLILSGAAKRTNKPITGGFLKHVTHGFRQAFKEQTTRGLVGSAANKAEKAYAHGDLRGARAAAKTVSKLLPKGAK